MGWERAWHGGTESRSAKGDVPLSPTMTDDDGKRKSDYLVMGSFASECQNTYLNQIWTIIIYREEMPNPRIRLKESEYILGFCLTEINNSVFQFYLGLSLTAKNLTVIFLFFWVVFKFCQGGKW